MIPCMLWTDNQQTAYSEVKFGIECFCLLVQSLAVDLFFLSLLLLLLLVLCHLKDKKNAKKPLELWENIKLIL